MKRFLLPLAFGLITIGLITACIKDEMEPLGDAGQTFLKFSEAPQKSLFFGPFNDIRKVSLFSLRRDPNSNAELTMPVSITVKLDQQIITNYNTAKGTNYETLPANFFTYDMDQGVSKNGNNFTLNFAAGDFAKNVGIKLDGSKWAGDLTKKYAFAFVISDAGGRQLAQGKDTMMVFLSIKNKWDGVYEVSGTMTDVFNPALVHMNVGLALSNEGLQQIELRTLSPTKCLVYDPIIWGEDNLAAIYDTDNQEFSGYGSFCVVVEFDEITNQVIAVSNLYGQPAANTRYAELDPAGVNSYDPSVKTVTIKYNMCQPSVIPDPPHIRTTWDETWKFIKDRE